VYKMCTTSITMAFLTNAKKYKEQKYTKNCLGVYA
jgi:hypothetical protein